MEEDAKSTSSLLPDGVVLGEHVVEVVEDPSWGEGLDEAEYALEEPDEDPPSGGAAVAEPAEIEPSGDLEEKVSVKDPVLEKMDQVAVPLKVKQVTLAVTLKSRHQAEVTQGLDLLFTRFKYLGLEPRRIHSDRAKEF
jgi:hypothetical protein